MANPIEVELKKIRQITNTNNDLKRLVGEFRPKSFSRSLNYQIINDGDPVSFPDISTGLVTYFNFNTETADQDSIDRTGNGHVGTSVGAIYGTPSRSELKSLIGGGVIVDVTGVSSVATAWTLSVWMRTKTTAASGLGAALTLGNGSVSVGFIGSNSPNGGLFEFKISNSPHDSATSIDGTWYHLAIVLSSGHLILYYNGTSIYNLVGTGTLDSLTIDTNNGTFSTPIDEVAIYNRALSPSEIVYLTAGNRPI